MIRQTLDIETCFWLIFQKFWLLLSFVTFNIRCRIRFMINGNGTDIVTGLVPVALKRTYRRKVSTGKINSTYSRVTYYNCDNACSNSEQGKCCNTLAQSTNGNCPSLNLLLNSVTGTTTSGHRDSLMSAVVISIP